MTFNDTLKKLREEKGLLQGELAKALGMNSQTYNSYEIGRREPSFEVLTKFADYFNVTTDYLLGRTPHPNTVVRTNNLPEDLLKAGIKEVIVRRDYANHKFTDEEIKALLDIFIKLEKAPD